MSISFSYIKRGAEAIGRTPTGICLYFSRLSAEEWASGEQIMYRRGRLCYRQDLDEMR
jgi:hypothetical protein